MKKVIILVLTNFFILTLILLGKPVKAQTTEITGQFLYGLQLYVLPEKTTTPDYSTAIYSSTIDENDFITSGLYENWLQPRLPDGINGYIYLVDSTHTIGNVYLGGGYLEQGQTLSYPYEPSIEMKHYNAQLITIFILNPVKKGYFESYGGRLDYIVYYENNDGSTPRIKLIDATTNENDYNRVKLAINGYDTGYNAGYSIGYNNGQISGYDNGYQDGQTNGYSAGYNAGQYDFYNDYYQQIYDDGYNAGLGDRQLGINTVVNFNQLIDNGDFSSITGWSGDSDNGTWYVENNELIYTINNVSVNYYSNRIQHSINRVESGNYLILSAYVQPQTTGNMYICLKQGNAFKYVQPQYNVIGGQWNRLIKIIHLDDYVNYVAICFNAYDNGYTQGETIKIKDFYCINLTQIYGIGNEPDINQFLEDFPSDYYTYTQQELININFENGYNSGYNDAYPLGYDDGKSYQATQQLTSDGWIKNIFVGIGSFLALEIIPNVSIGLIVGIPFIISVAWFVIKMARGGGNN